MKMKVLFTAALLISASPAFADYDAYEDVPAEESYELDNEELNKDELALEQENFESEGLGGARSIRRDDRFGRKCAPNRRLKRCPVLSGRRFPRYIYRTMCVPRVKGCPPVRG
jgi:hypothetical protein